MQQEAKQEIQQEQIKNNALEIAKRQNSFSELNTRAEQKVKALNNPEMTFRKGIVSEIFGEGTATFKKDKRKARAEIKQKIGLDFEGKTKEAENETLKAGQKQDLKGIETAVFKKDKTNNLLRTTFKTLAEAEQSKKAEA